MEKENCFVIINKVNKKISQSQISVYRNPLIYWRKDCANNDCKDVIIHCKGFHNSEFLKVKKVKLEKLYALLLPLTEKGNSHTFFYAIWDTKKKQMPVLYMFLPLFFTKAMADKNYKSFKSVAKGEHKRCILPVDYMEIRKIRKTDLINLITKK